MERRFQVHLQELLDDAVVEPEQCHGMLARLEQFVEPFAACLVRSKQRTLARQYVAGLVSQLNRKNVETIAYLHDQDRQPLQKFIGQTLGPPAPGRRVGPAGRRGDRRADGVLVIDPSGVPKQGKASVGVAAAVVRPAGKVDNCQVGVYLAYVSRTNRRWSMCGCTCPRIGPRSKTRAQKAASPRRSSFARGMNWPWK